ncbi:protein ZBED8-like, partial [Homarus americanus]|uniref:protein ZBED8-like n=1 Tax=Homarus americanus TaxID=6706 RepID=UPI001C474EA7
VAYRIAKQKKPHTIGETLVKPCALEMVELVCGLEQRKKIAAVPLSNDVIHSTIVDISSNILKQAIDILEMVNSFFAKQNFDWKKNLCTLCTDGEPAMLGNTSGFAALVKKEAPQVIVFYIGMHWRQSLSQQF